jgi:hypothetical protein
MVLLGPTSIDRDSEADLGMNQNDCGWNGDQKCRGDFQNQLAGPQPSTGRFLSCVGIVLKKEMIGGPPAPFTFSFLTVTPASGLSTIRLKATYAATITIIAAAVLMILHILAHGHDVG